MLFFRTARRGIVSRIVFLNVLVFLGWIFAGPREDSFMARHFLVSYEALREGRVWTLVTSVFSHASFWHIFLNLFVLQSFGSVMEQVLGARRFLRFYLGAGILASFCHSLVSALLLGAPALPALGASGAISGVVLLFALLFPREKILFFGILPVPAIFGALLFVGLDLRGLFQQAAGAQLPIGYGAHLGGSLYAFLYYVFVARRRRL